MSISMRDRKKIAETLLFEWRLKNGTWMGNTGDKYSDPYREDALRHLSETPDRHYYIPNFNSRLRISYYYVA